MSKISREQIEQREDEQAQQEYQMSYLDLPGDIKLNIHNTVLEKFGIRRSFKFTCSDCRKPFENEVEGSLIEIFTDIQSETHTEILEGVCPTCQDIKNKKVELWT